MKKKLLEKKISGLETISVEIMSLGNYSIFYFMVI